MLQRYGNEANGMSKNDYASWSKSDSFYTLPPTVPVWLKKKNPTAPENIQIQCKLDLSYNEMRASFSSFIFIMNKFEHMRTMCYIIWIGCFGLDVEHKNKGKKKC